MKDAVWLVAAFCVAVAGCATKYVEYRSGAEIPDGPGMLSGSEGSFVLYTTRDTDPERPALRRETMTETLDGNSASQRSSLESQQRQFEEFRRWKEANRDSPAYREFREWLEWRAYREWMKNAQEARELLRLFESGGLEGPAFLNDIALNQRADDRARRMGESGARRSE